MTVGSEKVDLKFKADSLTWAADGKHLAIADSSGGKLALWTVGDKEVDVIAEKTLGARWSPDGSLLLYGVAGKGVFVLRPGTDAVCVADDALAGVAAWAPDGDRLAYCAPDGIYSVNADGSNRRRLLKDQRARAMAWRPSDNSLTFISPGLKGVGTKAMTFQTGLPGAHRLVNLDADSLMWSPSGALLLAHTETGWITYDPAGGRINKLPEQVGTPRWQGSRKLRYGTALGIATGLGEFGPIDPFPQPVVADLVAWAEVPTVEFTNDMIFKSPFSGAQLPGSGEIRVEGYIDSADPLKGECTIQIQRLIDPAGKETNYTKGLSQMVAIAPGAMRNDGKATTPFRPIDLRSDLEVSLILTAEKPTAGQALPAREVWIAGSSAPSVGMITADAPRLSSAALDYDGVSNETVVVPLVFPVLNVNKWSDSFLANRDGGARRHHGQDLLAPKMTPIVACFDGIVTLGKPKKAGGHYTLTIRGDNGWIANYYHINNDTPGTDDGLGGDENAYAPGLESGQRVTAGQFIAYVGDSGNAEGTVPHLHFELWDSLTKGVVNAAPSLKAATTGSAAATVPSAQIKLLPKETRYDGIVKEVDVKAGLVTVSVISETVKGRSKAVTKSKTIVVKLAPKTESFVLGNENLPVVCDDLRPGLYAVVVGTLNGKDPLAPRIAAFAPRDDE